LGMKRSDALAPLSRQHHQGLFAAMKLKRADAATAVDARAAFADFWEREGRVHFRLEEELLLPAFARHAQHDHPAVVRVLTEHVDLRRRGADVTASAESDLGALHELGERLEQHIRHEERVLFPLIEAALPAEELESLAQATGHV
jgi:hemerythrin-like domain-containing protein